MNVQIAKGSTEITQGPTTPDGPSVDELRTMRRGYEETSRRVTDHCVANGMALNTDPGGEVAEHEMAALRRTASHSGQRARTTSRQHPESYTEARDPVTRAVVRTYEDGRTEIRG
ncbi:hypothetical protein ABZ714_12520 [Streptomyces sp. NPDC006798]|uniref:hypothetical protein n=1 Tax=Streptomyces sp. NPDC006798 TaxID=3155462 RepID=UPI0033D84302